MKENNKLIDAVLDLGLEMKAMRKQQEKTNHRLEKMQREQHKTNILLSEHSRSIITLADRFDGLQSNFGALRSEMNGMRSDLNGKIDTLNLSFNKYAQSNNTLVNNHESRIVRIENHSSMVSEPSAVYKKTKKKK